MNFLLRSLVIYNFIMCEVVINIVLINENFNFQLSFGEGIGNYMMIVRGFYFNFICDNFIFILFIRDVFVSGDILEINIV